MLLEQAWPACANAAALKILDGSPDAGCSEGLDASQGGKIR
jgi:hypothetical protein